MNTMDTKGRLRSEYADLPHEKQLQLTDVFSAALACVDVKLPGTDPHAHHQLSLTSGAKQLLVILVDGLGYYPLTQYFGHAPLLRSFRNDIHSIHTVVPSTTAAAITAFGTGAHPGATQMVGYSVAYRGRVMNLLAFEDGPEVTRWQSVPTHFERLAQAGHEASVIAPASFAGSGLTQAALRGSRHVGAFTLTERIDAALRELRSGQTVVYLYWSDIDHAGHVYGAGSSEWLGAFEEFDGGLAQLLRALPKGVATVMTADHGMVNVAQNDLIDVAQIPGLREDVELIAGETRAVHVHARAGMGARLRERWAEILQDKAWVLGPEEYAELIGPGPGGSVIGDAFVLSRQRFGIVDSRWQSAGAISMVGVHGSLTPEEMRIPVVQLS